MLQREDHVKIHYIGYSNRHDEWRDADELESWKEDGAIGGHELEPYAGPFDVHKELAYHIKMSLKGSRKDPVIRIETPFDQIIFNGGLRQSGNFLRKERGHEIYGIIQYKNLTPYLGKRWYIRILNRPMDFCYVKRDTVEYYLHRRAPVEEFNENGNLIQTHPRYVLIFKFVRMELHQK